MIFSKENARKIVRNEKTETRRLKRPRVKEGRTYPVRTSYFDRWARDRIKIMKIHRERLGTVSMGSVRREGCKTREEFFGMFEQVNKRHVHRNTKVYVIRFRYIGNE